MGHDNIKVDHIGFTAKPGGRKWADSALVDAFITMCVNLEHWTDFEPDKPDDVACRFTHYSREDWDYLVDEDSVNDIIYKEILEQDKVPTDNRVVLYTVSDDDIYLWEGPANSGLDEKIQKRFYEFVKTNARKVMKEEVAGLVKRGMATGLSRQDLIELVNEATIDEIMAS
jgi:hypothetical protein